MNRQVFTQTLKLMGNRFQISVVATNETWANEKIDAGVHEIRRIEKLLTTFTDDSETNRINALAGVSPLIVSQETFDLIERCIGISNLTQGAFDITYGSVDKSLWNFDQRMKQLPAVLNARKMVRLIDYKKICLDRANRSVFLLEKGMRIGFGGIGKGYAADQAKMVMQNLGVDSGVVNASGDLAAWGTQPGGHSWTIGIVNPDASGEVFSYLEISGLAVATSGNYEKFVLVDGKKFSHTINPRTGLPVTGIKSVTIITRNAELADAMATPVMIMGVNAGLDMINQLEGVAAIIIDYNNRLYASQNIHIKKRNDNSITQKHNQIN